MPYSYPDNLPDAVKNWPAKAQKVFAAVFNERIAAGDSEAVAFRKALGAGKAYAYLPAGRVKDEDALDSEVDWEASGEYLAALLDEYEIADEPEMRMQTLKAVEEQQLVYGVVLMADTPDMDGHVYPPETIRDAMHDFNRKHFGKRGKIIKDRHGEYIDAEVVESFQAPSDVEYELGTAPKDSWIMAVKIWDKKAWQMVKDGELVGLSPWVAWDKQQEVKVEA